MATYDPNWRQKAINEGKDQNSAEFADMRAAETMAKNPDGWRQVALDKGIDQNNPTELAKAGIYPGGTGGGMGIGGMGTGFNQPTIDLPKLYENLYNSSGIKAKQDELSAKEKQYIEVEGGINDNPFLSEATRVGRVAKLNDLYEKRTASLKNDIATAKADIETKLALETKQFDINSQQAQLALQQFNTLLGAGAFDNASGEDIANVTRSTGLSSSMIQSAIQANKDSKVQTATISFDDGSNQGFAIINSKTGEIISKQVVSASKPTSAGKATEGEQKAYYMDALRNDAAKGLTLSQILSLYTGYLDANLIYQLYNANSKYGPDKADSTTLARYGIKVSDE